MFLVLSCYWDKRGGSRLITINPPPVRVWLEGLSESFRDTVILVIVYSIFISISISTLYRCSKPSSCETYEKRRFHDVVCCQVIPSWNDPLTWAIWYSIFQHKCIILCSFYMHMPFTWPKHDEVGSFLVTNHALVCYLQYIHNTYTSISLLS